VTAGQDAPPKPERFRSPFAVGIWWLWVLFAVANLIDLAVQGRDHLTVDAAFILLLVTGVVYVTALRPRLLADADGLTIVNPLRDHRVVWAAIVGIDSAELLRVRCAWPLTAAPAAAGADTPASADDTASVDGTARADGTEGADGADAGPMGRRAIYAWAVHSSRRRQVAGQLRAERQARRRDAGRPARGFGAFGGYGTPDNPPPAPTAADSEHVVSTLTELAEQAKVTAPDQRAVPPVSSWYWPAFAAIIVPALVLLIAVLV
jgi:Bacterial PH domain